MLRLKVTDVGSPKGPNFNGLIHTVYYFTTVTNR